MLITRTYLELRAPSQLRPAPLDEPGAAFTLRASCDPAHYRAIYSAVGALWQWTDRLRWTDERLATYLASPRVAIWELAVGGVFAGYFELEQITDGSVEIAYFGLLPEFFGRRLGAAMLSRAASEAWAMGATRVWLHTCTLDSVQALPNYKARGFEEFLVEQYETE